MSDTPQDEARRLLPCPFCGGEADFERLEIGRWSVGCKDADGDCFGFQSLQTFARQAEAAAAWNTRAALGTGAGGGEASGTIMLEIAAADEAHQMWERRWRALLNLYAIERYLADRDGRWGLRDFLDYAGQACGFTQSGQATPLPTPDRAVEEAATLDRVIAYLLPHAADPEAANLIDDLAALKSGQDGG